MGNKTLLTVVFVVVVALLTGCGNQTKDELFQSGLTQLQTGNARGAVVLFRQALEHDPNFFEARYQLGVAYLRNKQYQQAEHEFEKVDRQYAGYNDLQLQLAEIYRQTERPAQAIEALNQYHREHPATASSLDLLGVVQALTRNFAAADTSFTQAAALDPQNPLPTYHRAQACLGQARHAEAAAILEALLATHPSFTPALDLLAEVYLTQNRIDDAIATYKRLFQTDSNNVKALYMRGLLLLSLGRLGEAPEILDLFPSRFPEDYRGQQLQGMVAYKNGEYDQAMVFLRQSLKRRPHPLTYYYLGLSHFQQKEYEQAINQYQRILDQQPDSSQARLMLAMTLLLQQRVEDCLAQTRHVLATDPRNGLAYNVLGSAYLQQKEYDKALDAFKHAIEIDPELIELHLKKSQSHELRGEAGMAEKELVLALDKAPQVLNTRLLLASHYMLKHDDASAMTVLRKGLSGTPADAPLYTCMAGIVSRKDPKEAVTYLKKARAADPAYRTPYFELANLYQLQGDHHRVVATYAELLERYPDDIKALVELGLAFELAGEPAQARDTFAKLAAIKHPEACLADAMQQLRQGNLRAATDSLDRGLKLDENDTALLRAQIDLLLLQNRLADAAPFLTRLEQLEPGVSEKLLAVHLLARHDLDGARQRAERLRKSHPEAADGDLLLAAVLETGGDLQAARDLISARLAAEPQNPDLRLQLALLREKCGDKDQAIADFRELLRQFPHYAPAHFALGTIFDQRGDTAAARRCYQDALARNADFVPAINNLAFLEAADHQADEALLLALRAYRLAPGEAGVLDTLGVALLAKQRLTEARTILEKARTLSGGNPSIRYHLAQVYIAAQHPGRARVELEQALASGDFPEAALCRELLQQLRS